MCGILCCFGKVDRTLMLRLSALLRHRGPDWSGIHVGDNCTMCHERLAIVDPHGEAQPLYSGKSVLSINGEIYNHRQLRAEHCQGADFATDSDCEPIVHMYGQLGSRLVSLLDGDFAFCVTDTTSYLAARDPTGVCPLYYGVGADGSMWFASELKALKEMCPRFYVFPPGHYYTPDEGFVRYYQPVWRTPRTEWAQEPLDLGRLRESFEAAVHKRLDVVDVPFGVLLSGGLDSSLVASVAARRVSEWGQLHTFSIGLEGSTDLPRAREVADFLHTRHHEFHFTIQQGLDAIRDVIWHLETFDCTTVRASTPMYLLARKIQAMGIKMVLSGEGADEVLGGYLYFHLAPTASDMQDEMVSRVENLHLADNLRANKSTMAWGLEARVPFLDRDFLDVVMTLDPAEKLHRPDTRDAEGRPRIEKYVMRKAFDDGTYLPDSVLWRQKEQFSDGVGYSWIDSLKAHADTQVSDAQMEMAPYRFPHLPPTTKEAYWYRTLFEELFPERSAEETVRTWVPRWSASADPSGRAQLVHVKTTE